MPRISPCCCNASRGCAGRANFSAGGSMRTTLTALQAMRDKDEKIAVLTCYDASFAALLEAQGVDVLLVGDSLGMVLQGHETTLPVSLDDMVYHTACVARGAAQARSEEHTSELQSPKDLVCRLLLEKK